MEQQLRQREIIARTVNGAREMLAKLIAETNSTDSAYAAEWRERATFWRDQGDRAQMRKCAQEMRWHMQHSR